MDEVPISIHDDIPDEQLLQLREKKKGVVTQRELQDMDEAIKQLKYQLHIAQNKMKTHANKKRVDTKFAIGDWVFLKLRPHDQVILGARICPKLSPHYYGPFQILEKVGAVAYKLKFLESSRIHLVFHVSLLKRAVGNYNVQANLPQELASDNANNVEPELVLASRIVVKDIYIIRQVLVQWKGQRANDAIWEDELNIRSQLPNYDLRTSLLL
ncbi:uncharacterized protein [Cicer arietinum]|uniref:uncharacterized protein n=1 Tax=Cicer arietinum TaxID=3827 RepID=UPI00032A8577